MANKQVELNQIVINRAKPGDVLIDTKCTGLQLEVSPKGIKSWFHRFRFNGKQPRHKIGSLSAMGLAEARAAVAAERAMIDRGEMPTGRKPKDKTLQSDVAKWTLEELMERYIADTEARWNNRSGTGAEIRARMRNHVFPHIRPQTKAVTITLDQLLDALKPLAKRSPSQLAKVVKDVRAIINHISLKAPALRNQVLHLDKGELSAHFATELSKHEEMSYAYVPVDAAPAFYAHFRAVMESNPVKRALAPEALLFVMLTAARTAEVIGHKPKPGKPERVTHPMTWREVDFDGAFWIIPGSRTKSGYDHIVPLSPAALAILSRAKLKSLKTGPDDIVFPSHMPGTDGWMSNNALMSQVKKGPTYKIFEQKKNKGGKVVERHPTVHGLRSTFTTFAMKAGFSPELVSLSIAHKMDHSTKDTSFDNYWKGQMVEERRALMNAWADFCTKGKTPRGWKEETNERMTKLYSLGGLKVQKGS